MKQLDQQWSLGTIISGGQTGVDRAALDCAIGRKKNHGGWCPKGRMASDGLLPPHYLLRETDPNGYRKRTKLNVTDIDATLIFNFEALEGGSIQTVKLTQILSKPFWVIQLESCQPQEAADEISGWLKLFQCSVLNIAGPSEARRPGIYARVLSVLNAHPNTATDFT